MKQILHFMLAGTLASGTFAYVAAGDKAVADAPGEVQLSRIDCGRSEGPRDIAAFSDTHAYDGKKISLVASCYLIAHDDEMLLWDTGYSAEQAQRPDSGLVMDQTIVEQLAKGGISANDIDYVGISHYHGDHIGQAKDFPGATLIIGKADKDALEQVAMTGGSEAMGSPNAKPLLHWITGDGKSKPVEGDNDIFGDGSVIMLDTPGHTPGHHALLVRLASGDVMLTGDAAHFTANYENDGVPTFNTDRADTLASLDRFKRMADNLDALVIIQHEADDIAKLPAFPDMAR